MAHPRYRLTGRPRAAGFALLAVLWILFGVGALALAMALAGRQAVATAQHRLDLTRARWGAEDCIERARSAIADVLAGHATWLPDNGTPQVPLDSAVAGAPILLAAHCEISVQPTGIALDVNRAEGTTLQALFRAVGVGDTAAAELARAVVEWRDTTALARTADAWYLSRHRPLPRHAAFVDVHELHLVHGYDEAQALAPALDTLLTVEPDRVLIDRAPAPILSTLPGLIADGVAQVLAARAAGIRVTDGASLAATLSGAARDSVAAHLVTLSKLTTATPAAWLVRAVDTAGASPSVISSIELRLVRAGTRAAVLRRKVWP